MNSFTKNFMNIIYNFGDFWEFQMVALDGTVNRNALFTIYLMILLYVFVKNEKCEKMKIFIVYNIIFFVIFLFPLTAHIIIRYVTGSLVFWRIFWLLPISIVSSYVFVYLSDSIKENGKKFVFWLGVVAILLIGARGMTVYELTERSENPYKLPNVVIEVIEVINMDATINDIERKQVVFPPGMYPFVRQYDASIHMTFSAVNFRLSQGERLYGINQELFNMIYYGEFNGRRLGQLLKLERYNYFVIWKYHPELVSLSPSFYRVGEVSDYAIFRGRSFILHPTYFNGVDYSPVFDYYFYLERYPDVKEDVGIDSYAVLEHFVTIGMSEGRIGSGEFNVFYYRENYPDLVFELGEELEDFFYHYLRYGVYEGLVASRLFPVKDGRNYDVVFNFDFFIKRYPELVAGFNTREEVLEFFVTEGMAMGLQGSAEFDVFFYMERFADVREYFGDDIISYYLHFIYDGAEEGRRAFEQPRFNRF